MAGPAGLGDDTIDGLSFTPTDQDDPLRPEPDIAASSDPAGPSEAARSTVLYAPALFGDDARSAAVPHVPFEHIDGCGCVACGMPSEEQVRRAAQLAQDTEGGTLGPAVSAPSQLGDLADFLTTTFWSNFGTVPREFNLTSTGLNPKSGVLHYNVSGFTNAGSAGSDSNGISAARAALVRDVLDVFSEVLGITFVETTSSDITFTDLFFKDTDFGRAYANSAGFSSGIQYSWINIGPDWSGGTSTYNDYTLQTIFHEVGHALGLGHQGLYNGSGSYPSDADFENDSWQATMMSYFSQSENTTIPASFAFLQTPMAVDWIALEDIYGNQSFGGTDFGTGNAFAGDTVYGFNTNIAPTTSRIWAEFATYANRTASTIVDAGGIDTLDVSGYSAAQLINLRPTSRFDTAPSISNIGGLTGNLTLAEGTVIENAVGGSGADTFFGNDADNVLTGNGGNDTFNDSAGNDTYLGGAGTDTVNFFDLFSSFSFSIGGTFLSVVNVATDLVENTVEFLSFSDQVLRFQDILDGLAGNTAPVAADDTVSADADAPLAGASLLANDTDADGDDLSVASVNGLAASVGVQIALASGALLTVNPDGTFLYDPNGAFDALQAGEFGTDSFTYTATDGEDVSAEATVTVAVQGRATPPSDAIIGESGTVTVAQSGPDQWHSVSFSTVIRDAVVVLGPPGRSDDDPVTTRVRNVTDTGFEFQIDEWDYLDGVHGPETLGWLAIAEGTHRLAGGQSIVAARTVIGTAETAISFGATLAAPVVLAEVSSDGFAGALTSRLADVTATGFAARLQQEEGAGGQIPPVETLSWIALEAGRNGDYEAFITPDEVRDSISGYGFSSGFALPPVLLADMQTADGRDAATTRLAGLDASGVSLFIEEEQSADSEVGHTTESVGIVALAGGLIRSEAAVNSPPAAFEDAASVGEGAPLLLDVLSNDSDPDGDTLSVDAIDGQVISVGGTVTLASGARVTLNADQTILYDQNGVFDGLASGETGLDGFVYSVDDGRGGTSQAVVSIAVEGRDAPPVASAIGESGRVSVSQGGPDQWHSVSFSESIANAVVVLGPVSSNDDAPLTTRLRNVTDTGFEFQIDEWDYLDGAHAAETLGWLAISEGRHTLASGQTILAGTVSAGASFAPVSFGETLENAVVFAEVASVNEAAAVTTRIRDVTAQGFDLRIQEEEAAGAHVPETVSWIAIEAGGAGGFEVVRTGPAVDETPDSFVFASAFAEAPVLIADMQTTRGSDPATLRVSALGASSMSLRVEEEQSADAETDHIDEAVGYLVLDEGLVYLDTFLV